MTIKKTKSNTGALINIYFVKILKINQSNYFHFNVCGKDKKNYSDEAQKLFVSSPFGYLIKNKGKNLFVSLDYKDTLTFVRVAEENSRMKFGSI